jgi:single-stranded DNA-binding protein
MSASTPAANVVTLVGNPTADPVTKQLDVGRSSGAQADACAKYLTKRRAVAVTGRLVYREWDDNGTRRSRHHIIGRVRFGGRPDEPTNGNDEDAI